ncbi:MAG: ABC transporter substrate-binding protein [Pseudomonadota bacterium]
MKVWLGGAPYSMDPLDYDAFVHHVSGRSCYAPIVSQYKTGTFLPVVAESWSASSDFMTWRFRIRAGLHFDNGDVITPDMVRKSLTRIAFLQHQRGSKSGFTEHLKGLDKLDSASGIFEGLQTTSDSIVLQFDSPQPKLLETISFGIYGIVHPKDYDSVTGQWRDPHQLIASGSYSISSWTPDGITLALRREYPTELRHKKASEKIFLTWGAKNRNAADLAMGSTLDSELTNNYDLYAPGATSASIFYVTNYSWKHKSSPVNNSKVRQDMRAAFYRSLASKGIKPTLSFLPITIPGIREFEIVESPHLSSLHGSEVRGLARLEQGEFKTKIVDAITDAVQSVDGKYIDVPELTTKQRGYHHNPDQDSYLVDVYPTITGILVEDPDADVRFMILSKEGIRLPDPSGRLALEAAKPKLDLAAVNQIIWDDAVVWPVAHFRSGLWARKGLFDMSLLNLSLPPTDLSLIGMSN